MDEQKLRDIFSSAVRDVPPASFDDRDVAAVAKRLTARKRSMLIGGSVFVVVIGVGIVIGTGTLGSDSTGGTSSAAGQAVAGSQTSGRSNAAPGARGPQAQVPKNGTNFPATPLQGGGAGGVGPGAGSTPSGCGPTDSELAVALANELASAGAPKGLPAGLGCPAGSRTAGYLVHDGSATGYVVAVVTKAGAPAPGIANVGAARASAPASNGRTVTVLSVPSAGSPSAPLSGAIFGIAEDLAGKV